MKCPYRWPRGLKCGIHSQLNWAILLCDVIPNGKTWVNCAVLTGNSAGLRTALFQSYFTQNCAGNPTVYSVLPADTTMASSQGASVSSTPFNRWASHDIFLFKYHFLRTPHFTLCFIFSDNIMADVAGKRQTTAVFLSTTVTRTRRHTELTSLIGNLCCAREHSVQFFVQLFFFTQLNCTV